MQNGIGLVNTDAHTWCGMDTLDLWDMCGTICNSVYSFLVDEMLFGFLMHFLLLLGGSNSVFFLSTDYGWLDLNVGIALMRMARLLTIAL
jgi:hypothetical protein